MNIKNLAIIVVGCDVLNLDERDKMFYMTFKDKEEIGSYLHEHRFYQDEDIDTSFNTYNINNFLTEMNSDTTPLVDEWVIPVFIENYQANLPNAFFDKLLNDSEKDEINLCEANSIDRLREVYSQSRNEVIKLIKNDGNNCVNIAGHTYSVDNNGDIQRDWETYEDTWYGECETFDVIKQYFADNGEKMRLAGLVLNLNCEHITMLMWKLDLWNVHQKVCSFTEVGELIKDYNGDGYNVECEIQSLHDYYVYGYVDEDTKTAHINGLTDNRDEWELFLTIYDVCDLIMEDKDAYDYLMKLFNEEIESGKEE